MIPITRDEGKALIQIIPQYISRTVHKRHYYITDCPKAMAELDKYRESKVRKD